MDSGDGNGLTIDKSIFALLILIGMGFYFAGKKWFGKTEWIFFLNLRWRRRSRSICFIISIETWKAGMPSVPDHKGAVCVCADLNVRLFSGSDGKGVPHQEDRRDTFIVAAGFPNVVLSDFL